MKALVTGGGGFLGGAIIDRLLARGDVVRSYSRGDYPALRAKGVEVIRGDLSNAVAVAGAIRGCDVVFHVAAKAGVWGPYREYHEANAAGTENVLRACADEGIRRLVFTSSPSVIFDGSDMEGIDESAPYPRHYEAPYPHTKAIAEQAVLAANGSKLATVALRPHLIWGPRDTNLVPRIVARAHSLRRIGDTDPLVDSTYIDNAADAHVLAADRLTPGCPIAGRAYFISNGEPRKLWDLVNGILAAAGKPPVNRSVSRTTALAAAWCVEGLYRMLRLPGEPRLTRFVVQEISTAHWFDISAARRDLSYSPAVSIDEGLARLSGWFREGSNQPRPEGVALGSPPKGGGEASRTRCH